MKKLIISTIYIMAICAANLSAATFGPAITPVNAFLLIGLDMVLRDKLHESIGVRKMLVLIGIAGAVSFLISPSAQNIAIASVAAFALSAIVDNGAFSYWKSGTVIDDWSFFYDKLAKVYHHPKIAFFVIPDVITGGESENDELIRQVPAEFRDKAAPTWHMHESIRRLLVLADTWPRVCIGSSGEYAAVRSKPWIRRMHHAMKALIVTGRAPLLHGLRMLDGRVMGNYPLATADSTNLATNVPKTRLMYPDLTRNVLESDFVKGLSDAEKQRIVLKHRCAILKGAVESVKPPSYAEWYDKNMRLSK